MADFLQPGERFERYRVIRPLGRGGMAEVVLVRHTELETLHALKVLTITGPTLGDRMRDEGRLQAQLNHPNVVPVTDVLTVKGMPALVMAYVEGPELGKWISAEQPGPALAEQVFRGIVAGVAAAHAAGHVHRDLKPGNVLLAIGDDGAIVPKVTDFGLVKALQSLDGEQARTRTGLPLGTPQYMAPEQMRDASKVDERADVFSLGCILYELVAHERAHPGDDLVDIFTRVAKGARKPLPAGTPAHLRRTIDLCLQADPDARPANCAAILALLDADDTPRGQAPGGLGALMGGDSVDVSPRIMGPPPPSALGPRLRREVEGGLAWIGAPAAAVGAVLGSVFVVGLLSVGIAFVTLRDDHACPDRPGVIGYARGPWVFYKPAGSTWRVEAPLEVGPIPQSPDDAGRAPGRADVVCVLPPGAQVTVVDPALLRHDVEWVPIHGDHVAYGAVDAPVGEGEAEGMVGSRCEAAPGERIGWLFTRPEGNAVPKAGGKWKLTYPRAVFGAWSKDPPSEPPKTAPVCALRAGTWVDIAEEPVKSGSREWWIPVVAGRFEEPTEGQ